MIREFLTVAIGGAAGSMLRYALSAVMLTGVTLMGFPAGTFAVNALGSLLIGALMSSLSNRTLLLLLVVGFCGGFTTFSTFSADAVKLFKGGAWSAAALYITLSCAVSMICTALGIWIGTTITK